MEYDAAFEMGKRPSRQRRHLPTAVTSAANTRASTKQNIPLLKMNFREACQENDNEESAGTTTGYDTPINSLTSRKKRKTTTNAKYGYNNNNLKKKAQEFIKTNNKF